MPGVLVRTATRSGPVNQAVPSSGTLFVAGLLERGPTDAPQRARSLAELEVIFGGATAFGSVYDTARMFFEEEGSELWALRVVGAAATKATLTLEDALGDDTLAVDTIGAGSSAPTTTVEDGATAGTFRLRITQAGAGAATETYDNLLTPADAVDAVRASRLVRARDLASVTAAPAAGVRGGNQPANLAAAPLVGGADDRATVTAAVAVDALDKFGPELGAGMVALPGFPATAVAAGLKAHGKANRRLAAVAPALGTDPATATAQALALVAPDAEGLGYFYPWVRIPNANGAPGTKLVSPEGYVAAARARAHRDIGPWAAAAGDRATAKFVLEPEVKLTSAQGDALDEAGVSAIRTIAGTTRLYGWRSLSSDLANYALLVGRDVLNTVAVEAEKRLEQYVFASVSPQLLGDIAGTLKGLVDPMRARRGLHPRVVDGAQVDPGYSIDVGPTVNTDAVLNANKVAAVLALRVSPVGTLIDLTIVKAGLTATV